jgi:Zn-dependent peptidase ImmA (M78 family)
MTTLKPRYAHIERLTGKILADARVVAPAVPVEAMVRAHGCNVKASDLNEVSGVLVRSGNRAVIRVNNKHSEARRRFTIAHEFGHLLLHEGREVWFDQEFRFSLRSGISSTGSDIEEIEANFFAASLLMPDSLLLNDPRAASIEVEDATAIKDLAKSYGVSGQAMTLRLARLIGRRNAATMVVPIRSTARQ